MAIVFGPMAVELGCASERDQTAASSIHSGLDAPGGAPITQDVVIRI